MLMPNPLRRKKTYAIGDVHGCLEPLRALMARLSLRKTDELLFIGDYIDRGPDSKGVVDFVLELRRAAPAR